MARPLVLWLTCGVLLLAGCVTKPVLEVTDCDPRYRSDCWSVTKEHLQFLFDSKDAMYEAQDALEECQKRL